ncbi:MAG TPA: tetratricopeptide repeat protein [Terriglobales bacterium]|nr:tetratricopeptide repeat protein [Terriglobales bacterium]
MYDFLRSLLSTLLLAPIALLAQTLTPATSSNSKGYVGNQACAACHTSIYNSYAKTSMAHASGPAIDNFTPADFVHQKSGVHFRIYTDDGRVWLSFERLNDPSVRGKRQLLYSIGSGRRGQSYLFVLDGFLFESPVNWYTNRHVWDMAPAYGNATQIPMSLPAFASCLHCHVSGMQPPVHGTENRYPTPPFSYSGVTCERCHGPGAAHVKGGAIVNPAKLDPAKRDAVCIQCHLEGKAAIERTGRHIYDFQPGQQLSDYISYFVFAGDQHSGIGAVSQFEALAQSACKKKSGNAMSCTSCHDPHSEPSAAERVSYYRQKCLACHGEKFGTAHHSKQPDCTACHMPSSLSTDVAHTEVTDHRILRRPLISPQLLQDAKTMPQLVPFPDSQKNNGNVRDLALAWQSLVNGGITAAAPEAERLLHSALEKSPNDPALLSALGFSAQKKGDIARARALYEKALAVDPSSIDAATNLGVIEANSGHLREAIKLWQDAFSRAPGQSRIGMNIARVFCEARQDNKARDYVLRVLEFNPDLPEAKTLLQRLSDDSPKCTN